jgi:Ca-activated chloride channel family protein
MRTGCEVRRFSSLYSGVELLLGRYVGHLLIVPALSLIASGAALSPAGAIQADEAKIYATVVGANGNPVPRLTAADFSLRENGEEKRIARADLATEPMSVELITDRLGKSPEFTPDQMRAGLAAFVRVLLLVNPDSVISLRTFDSEAVQQLKPTSSAVQLANVIKTLFTNNGNSVLLDAIADASEALVNAPNSHRVIIGLIAGYKGDTSSITSLAAAQRLRRSGASFWVLEATASGVSNPSRDVMLNQATRDSGGFHSTVAIGTALEGAATRLAALVVSQYAITYAAPSSAANRRIDLTVKSDARILAPHWAPDR